MREIKFRFWNKSLRTMIPWESLSGQILSFTFNSHLLPLQYTGLKDMNGNEIYEGDILRKDSFVRTIEWSAPQYVVKPVDRWSIDHDIKPTPIYYSGYHEVIGNIYENPELLKA